MTDTGSVEAAKAALLAAYGTIDILVNAAGGNRESPAAPRTPSRVFDGAIAVASSAYDQKIVSSVWEGVFLMRLSLAACF